MFFQVYGEHALAQWGMLLVVLAGLILLNEFARRTKAGGCIMFFVIPIILTVYFLAIWIGVKTGAQWALQNQTHVYMQGWFHYAKLYAATAGCIGFMMIKYKWGIGAKHWFKPFPFIIVAINILIACASDFESAAMGWNKWWLTSEGVWQYGGWHNVMNGVAGIINIFCMTAWWNVYPSKDKKDMIWADMTWVYIVIYDIWNFAYTYNCLPTHSWYCGVALLLAPTIAALLWNRGGWIQNRANTLAIWCMFAQDMVEKIADRLGLPKPSRIIHIEDITTPAQRNKASKERAEDGTHIIPAPTFEVKRQFSGYFLDPKRSLKNMSYKRPLATEKTVVRPTFSYLGRYEISDKVISDIVHLMARSEERRVGKEC